MSLCLKKAMRSEMNKKVIINDKMQVGHYYLTEEIGQNFGEGFCPELTPKEMLELGVFGVST